MNEPKTVAVLQSLRNLRNARNNGGLRNPLPLRPDPLDEPAKDRLGKDTRVSNATPLLTNMSTQS